jgi:site-specific recombinase XerD
MLIFGWVEEYAENSGVTEYCPELGRLFLTEYRLYPKHCPSLFNKAKILVRRLDEINENKKFSLYLPISMPSVPPQFKEWHEKYCEHLKQSNCKEATITSHKRYAARLLDGLAGKVISYDKLTAADIYDFFTNTTNIPLHSNYVIKRFLTFLFKNNVTKTDLGFCVPRHSLPRALPSIYTGDEISKVLAAVDRSEYIGKRDYAILMLASQLGMRSSDIVNLSAKNIDVVNKTISIIQIKTAEPQTLVMNAEVEAAINDYINNGRGNSESDKIFLSSRVPFMPITPDVCWAITQKYFKLAGIAPQGRHQGPHALRASYATALVDKGVPYAVVQEALGHSDPESSRYYIRTDLRRLRNCALDIPKPTGAFAVMLNDLEGTV